MNKGGNATKKPRLAGLDFRDVPSNETDVPHNYFAGARALNCQAIMNPVISKVENSPDQAAKK